MDEILRTEHVSYDYVNHNEDDTEEYTVALEDVSISIREGEFVAILGRNGSGKSTLAKLLNGILIPTKGEVYVGAVNTKEEDRLLDIRKTVGMVFQNPDNQIIANIVEEDVGFGPENIGIPSQEIWQRVEESLAAVDMLHYRSASPNNLSGGQKQRVAIAGVLAMKPRCIVLDESTAMLDPDGRRDVLETVKHLNEKEGMTIVIITHYMEEVAYADRAIIIDNDHVVLEGTPKEIFSQGDRIREMGLDVPQVTELSDLLRAEGVDLPAGIITIDELIDGLTREENKGK